MAKNYIQDGDTLYLNVGTGKVSGQAVKVGQIVGVCIADADTSGYAPVITRGVVDVSVVANDGTNDAAVAVGDALYIQDDGTINKNSSGVLFGYALETVTAGATDTINVKLR